MKREYFKYEFGFVSIDDEFIYFSSTGNGTELKKLTEKDKIVRVNHWLKSSSTILYLSIFTIIMLAVQFIRLDFGELSLLSIGGAGFLGYQLYQYMRTEIGARFKIPRKKILEIILINSDAVIKFRDRQNLENKYKIKRIPEKGRQILAKHFHQNLVLLAWHLFSDSGTSSCF